MTALTKDDLQRALQQQLEAVTGILDRRIDDSENRITQRITLAEQHTGERLVSVDRQIELLARTVGDGFDAQQQQMTELGTQIRELDVQARLRAVERRLDKLEN